MRGRTAHGLGTAAVALVVTSGLVASAGTAGATGGAHVDQAVVDGPGLDEPIVVADAGNTKLPALTGLLLALSEADAADPLSARVTGEAPELLDVAPSQELGVGLVITWDLTTATTDDASAAEGTAHHVIRQEVYPNAEGGPLVHTRPAQTFTTIDGGAGAGNPDEAGPRPGQTVGGWYRAPDALNAMLHHMGLPYEGELAERLGIPYDPLAWDRPTPPERRDETPAAATDDDETSRWWLLLAAAVVAAGGAAVAAGGTLGPTGPRP